MPDVSLHAQPDADLDALDEAVANTPASDGLAMRQVFDDSQLTGKLMGFLGADNARAFDAQVERMTGQSFQLTPDQANERFGIDGALAFKEDVTEEEASFKHNETQRRLFKDEVLSRSTLNPLQAIGAGVAGGLLDPVGLPLMFAPELFGVRAGLEGLIGARAGLAAGETIVKAGRVANAVRGSMVGATEGAIGGAIYEVPNYGLRRASGEDDYTLGDSLANVVLGAVLGGGIGVVAGFLTGAGRPRGRAGLPDSVDALDHDARLGASLHAVDTMADDRTVDVGALVDRELDMRRAKPDAGPLDETSAEPAIKAAMLEEATAITARGTEVPVRFALVELDDLITSHSNDMEANAAFPAELQPRDRSRAGSIAANRGLETRLNPKLLMRDQAASAGAPIVAPGGSVESGNGRTIALRRSADTNGEAYGRYLGELKAQGLDVSEFKRPVLVRMRTNPMTGDARVRLSREMNETVLEQMGAAEQAMSDAGALDPAAMALLDGTPQGERAFARAFILKVAPSQSNAMVSADGALSKVGADRMKAALMAKAYGDTRLVEALFEATDPSIKVIGQALGDAASSWAQMRSMAAKGDIPAVLDITAHLKSAVALVRWARDTGKDVPEAIAEALQRQELFAGDEISPASEAFLRLFFRDGTFRQHRAADKIAFVLKEYSRRASEVAPGVDLFGLEANDNTAHEILEHVAKRYASGEPAELALPELPGPGGPGERPPPIDLRPEPQPGPAGEGGQPGAGKTGQDQGVALPSVAAEAVLIVNATIVRPAAFADHASGKLLSGVIAPDGRLHVFKDEYGEAGRHEQFLIDVGADSDAYVQLSSFNNGQVAASVKAPLTRGQARALATLEASTKRAPQGDFVLQHYARGPDGALALIEKPPGGPLPPAPDGNAPPPAGGGVREGVSPTLAARPQSLADPIAADPELKALADDTDALAAAHGVEIPPALASENPATVAEAIRVAAICLADEIGGIG